MVKKKKIHHVIVELAQIQGFLDGLIIAIGTVSRDVESLRASLEQEEETQ